MHLILLGDEIMDVKLPEEQEQQLYNSIQGLLQKAVEETERKTAISSPWLKGKKAVCKYLGISDQTLGKLIKAGLPVHFVDGLESVHFFYKPEITEFLKAQ